ncbi:MAG: polysaccharide biosynthesis tyrosine autokinase [Chitinophagaceae bacterium]|nr:polysaccharide biosynthesis tyrosine autokinase [Chitinophagaceae bacterium]
MDNNSNYPSGFNPQNEQSTINAKEFLWRYLHYAWLFVFTVALSLLVAWIYLRYAKPVFSVSSTLLIRNDNETRGGGGGMNSEDMFSDIALFQSNTNKQNEILILGSRTMMERVVKSLGLQTEYAVEGKVKTTNVFPDQPFDFRIDSLRDSTSSFSYLIHFSQDWKTFRIGESQMEWAMGQELKTSEGIFRLLPRQSSYVNQPFRDFTVTRMPLQDAASSFIGGLDVKPANDLSNVLMLSYVNENPLLSTAILNELMVQYNNAAIQDKNEINRKILVFINDRLRLVESQLDTVEGNLQRYRTSKDVINLTAQSGMYFENMTQLNTSQRQQEVQLQVASLLEQYLNQPANRLSLVPSTLGLTDPTLLQLTAGYNQLVGDRLTQLQTGATLNNPVVKNLESNIEEARIKMLQSLVNIKKVYSNNIEALNAQNGSLRKQISSIPEKEKGTKERSRQQEIKQNLYLYLMQKREESEIAQASTIANSRILDTALPVYNKVSPIGVKIYGIALLIGLLLPVIIIYIRELLNDKVTTRADITKITDAPILGEIGHSEEEKVLLFPESSRTIVAEQMRILRSNLRYILGDKSDKATILVTSSFSGEGKSFISTNLGATLAISGKKTVILEFDLRKPKILEGLGLPKGQGLTNYLVGSATLEELAQPVPQVPDLFVIPCGPVPPNPSEILLSPKITELFKWLKQRFDMIVIDTAPIGLVSDSFTLSQYADSTIYVVRQRYTYKRQINYINELYKQKKMAHMGLLVNDVVSEGSKGYYGYGGGKYGYGYGYGYGYAGSYFEGSAKMKRSVFNRIKRIFR